MTFKQMCIAIKVAPTLLLMALSFGVAWAQSPGGNRDSTAVLSAKHMCCAKESGPAIAELSKIPGVRKVIADHQSRTLTIISQGSANPSPKAIWEIAERVRIEPFRLATAQRVYSTKPR